jgi:hypothetical protein
MDNSFGALTTAPPDERLPSQADYLRGHGIQAFGTFGHSGAEFPE